MITKLVDADGAVLQIDADGDLCMSDRYFACSFRIRDRTELQRLRRWLAQEFDAFLEGRGDG